MGLFRRIAMVVPNALGIYAPSRIESDPVEIDDASFLENFADNARSILVSFSDDGISDPEPRTAWGFGLKAWFIDED